ncbi:MAG: class I SAM-dependent methyltransferase [Anaerolineae bacterium]|nr:class I SAM-dependent methyltransferase [Anaerolineae bacterium]
MTAHDRVRWDAAYRDRIAEGGYPDPDPLLFQFTPPLRAGTTATALDVAAGLGQNGLWLAEQGYTVDLIDVSRVALLHAQAEATRRNLRSANFLQRDLDGAAFEPNAYDLVCVFRFLQRDLIAPIRAAVRPGGRVIYQTYNTRYQALRPTMHPDYLLGIGELSGYFGDWKLLYNSEPQHISQIVAVKPEKRSAEC